MNSREKGKRGERQWRDELRAQGFTARRGQQFSGSPDSPDVVCEELVLFHFEVKTVEKLNIEDAMAQARRDAKEKIPLLAHKRNFRPWLITMDADTFFKLIRLDLPGRAAPGGARSPSAPISAAPPPLYMDLPSPNQSCPSCPSCPFRPQVFQHSTINSQLDIRAPHGGRQSQQTEQPNK